MYLYTSQSKISFVYSLGKLGKHYANESVKDIIKKMEADERHELILSFVHEMGMRHV